MKTKSVTLKLTNCLDCPHHKVITSTYTGDSFDAGDVDVVCTLASGTHRGQHDTIKGKAISVGDLMRNVRNVKFQSGVR